MRIAKPQSENNAWKMHTTGEQIQNFASWLWGIGCFIFIIVGLIQIVADRAFFGILIMVFGLLFTWISTRFVQGFGELIENTADTCVYTSRIVAILESQCASEADNSHATSTDENDSDNA